MRGNLKRWLLIVAGTVCVVLAAIGAVVPLLPTTPFLLLAAGCYLRSSDRMYRWLHENKFFGAYLSRYRSGEGLPLKAKVSLLLLLWASLSYSSFVALPARLWWVRLLLLGVGLGVTIHLLRIKTYQRK
jgi:uncharacterized membrane protein YbaN (DUF454 family)